MKFLIAFVNDVSAVKNFKILSAMFLVVATIFFGGCGKQNPQPAPAQETRQTENRQETVERREEPKQEIGRPLDTSIEVSKDAMDRFIQVAKNYKLTESEVRRLVQIFTQAGMNFDPQLRISIKPVMEEKLVSAMRPLEYKTLGYNVECQYPGTKPQLIVDGIPHNARGWYILTYGQDDTGKDFEIYFKFMFGEDVRPIYKNHRIIDTVETLSCTVTDETFKKMYNVIANEASKKGKFVEAQKFYESALSRDLTPEDYEKFLNGATDLKDLGITSVENVTYTGIKALKSTAQFSSENNELCISVFPDVIVESNVYGEGKKKFYSDFQFRPDGSLVKFKLWESKDKVN